MSNTNNKKPKGSDINEVAGINAVRNMLGIPYTKTKPNSKLNKTKPKNNSKKNEEKKVIDGINNQVQRMLDRIEKEKEKIENLDSKYDDIVNVIQDIYTEGFFIENKENKTNKEYKRRITFINNRLRSYINLEKELNKIKGLQLKVDDNLQNLYSATNKYKMKIKNYKNLLTPIYDNLKKELKSIAASLLKTKNTLKELKKHTKPLEKDVINTTTKLKKLERANKLERAKRTGTNPEAEEFIPDRMGNNAELNLTAINNRYKAVKKYEPNTHEKKHGTVLVSNPILIKIKKHIDSLLNIFQKVCEYRMEELKREMEAKNSIPRYKNLFEEKYKGKKINEKYMKAVVEYNAYKNLIAYKDDHLNDKQDLYDDLLDIEKSVQKHMNRTELKKFYESLTYQSIMHTENEVFKKHLDIKKDCVLAGAHPDPTYEAVKAYLYAAYKRVGVVSKRKEYENLV